MIGSLVCPHLRNFTPYQSARSIVKNGRVLLDANENAYGSPVSWDDLPLNRYPDPLHPVLRTRIAEYAGAAPDAVFTGVGSDEIIDLLIRLVCRPGIDRILIAEPTYGLYRIAAEINGVAVDTVGLEGDFGLNPDAVLAAVTPSTKIVFCCSPNNPTGNLLQRSDLLAVASNIPGLMVIDQAYVEFSSDPAGNMADAAGHPENVIVLRTLSKAWGLAGIRLGYCIAHPSAVSWLDRIRPPYNVNVLSAAAALRALDNPDFVKQTVETVMEERKRIGELLEQLPGVCVVAPSEANFILVRFPDAANVHSVLSAGGIIVRRRQEKRLQQCLRITVGTPEENDRMIGLAGSAV